MQIKFRHKVLISFIVPTVILLITIMAIANKRKNFAEIERSIVRNTKVLDFELKKSNVILRAIELIVIKNELSELVRGRIKYEYLDTLGCLNTTFSEWDDVIDVTDYYASKLTK